MSVFEYLVLALALGIQLMVIMRSCAEMVPIRLTKGLAVSCLMALVYVAMLNGGFILGNALQFRSATDAALYDNVNSLVYLGLMIVVGVKILAGAVRKKQAVPAYDISRWGTVVLLAVASGVNVFLSGLALGFVVSHKTDAVLSSVIIGVIAFLLCYWAIMLGRQKKMIKERRWLLIAVLLLLVSAIFRVVG